MFIWGCAQNMKQPENSSDQALLHMAKGFSDNDQSVIDEVELFLKNKNNYFNSYENDLVQRGIEDPSEITKPIVLIDALVKSNKLVYQDGSSNPSDTILLLDKLSGNEISKNECYKQLESYYSNAEFGIGTYLGQKGDWPSIFECAQTAGFKLLAIDEDSDALALVLVKLNDISVVLNTAKQANINLWFTNQ